jgi:hypothetical protein
MRHGSAGSRWITLTTSLMTTLALCAASSMAQAQDAVPPPPPPPPPAPPEATPPPMTPPPAVATEAKPPTSAEAMPASRPDVLPPIDVGAWTRVGGKFQGSDPSKVNDWQMDNTYIELHAGGKIHKKVGVTVNLSSNVSAFPNNSFTTGSFVAIEDAIISFDIADEFHVWGGHLLVPVDRANASGPFFMIPWNYPGFFAGVSAPMEGPSGRNNGMVIWGDLMAGKLTYLAGVFDNAAVGTSPLYSGRLRLDLWDAEGGFWGNASFFGDKDILSIGVGGQYMKHGSTTMAGDKDWTDVNADVLVEKKLGGGSFVTGEGAYYHFNVNDGNISDMFYLLAAYATPTIGVGSIQPMARFQYEKVKGTDFKPWNIDIGVSYLIKGPALRLLATYSHTDLTTAFAAGPMASPITSANSVQLGAQAIFF